MEKPLIISNTTPIINFAEIDCLDVLISLYGAITITPAVAAELVAKSHRFPKAAKVAQQHVLEIVSPANKLLLQQLATRVHPGEAECLALALERPDSLLLLDDLAAREIAHASGCLFTGTIGCLIEAKRQGLIQAIRPLLDALRAKARFWIADSLTERVLRDAEE
jgi:predicted nucleic acid-binding protein